MSQLRKKIDSLRDPQPSPSDRSYVPPASDSD